MRTGQTHLFIPGPTNVPDAVRQAMNVAQQDMRASDFCQLTLPILADLKTVLRTETGTVMLFPGSGTAAWEAAITNTLNPGDRVLMARNGHFSTLWAQMADRLGLDVEVIDVAWGAGVPVTEIGRRLGADRHGAIKAVFVTHNETATGVTSDIAGVRRALDTSFHDALLFVDGVSSIGSLDFRMDDWGVDLAVAGSQKGLMCPAGLGVLGVSARAMELAPSATMRRAYFDFGDMARMNAVGQFPYTPPTPLLHGLRRALDRLLREEGLEAVITRHHRLAEGVRRGVAAMGLQIVAEHHTLASDTVTAIRTPEGVDAREVIRIAYEEFNTSLGSGLGPLDGRVFRIGHIGDLNEAMVLTALAVAELSLVRAGADLRLGAGVGAAQAFFAAERGTAPRMQIAAE
jgi:alanine-glyoxylate transaminase/serine-glyoxylate transaminase/serine-pyruvate transaminase